MFGTNTRRTDSTNRSKRLALCVDIVDRMRKLDSASCIPVFVCDPSGLGRLPKSSPEDLNIVAMDERMRKMEKKMNLFETKVPMNESLIDRIDIRVNSLQVSVEDHEG